MITDFTLKKLWKDLFKCWRDCCVYVHKHFGELSRNRNLCLYVCMLYIYMYMYVHIWIFDTVWWIMIYSKLSCDLRDKHRCKWFLICVFLMVMNFLKLLMLFYSFVISSSRSDWSRSDCLDVVFSLNSWFWK